MSNEYTCSACGSQLSWQPGQLELACAACGTISEPPQGEHLEAPAPVQEHRLDHAALNAPTGWGTETKTLKCNACTAVSQVEPNTTSTSCPFCASNHVIDGDDSIAVIKPESLVPFQIEKNDAIRNFRGWLKGLWFRPNSLKSAAQLEHINGVYIPAWTFDAIAQSTWTAQAGHYYYTSKVVNGKTKKVRETRWVPERGSRRGAYDDWLVQASGGLDQKAIKGLMPYQLDDLTPYAPHYLAGFKAERYTIDLKSAWKIAQQEIGRKEENECKRDVPGDTHKKLRVNTQFLAPHFKHLLLPTYIAAYRYQGKAFRYLVNGQTGTATGDAPISWYKVAGAVGAVLFVIGIVVAIIAITQN